MKSQLKSRKAFIAATVTTTLAATVLTPVGVYAAFTDVGASYKAAVQFLSTKGVQGFSSTQFGVSQPIKRVDAAVMLAKVLNLAIHDAPKSGFTDVPERAVGYVNALKAEGVVNGVSPTKFNANSYITRGEIAIMIQKAYGLPGDAKHKFTDVSSTFKQAVGALYNFNVTKGISAKHFGTNQPVTRGDFANMLHRASKIDPSTIPGGAANPSVFSIAKVESISPTEVEITFSKAVDSVKKDNFSIDGLTVKKAKLAENKKRVTLTVENMDYDTNYTIKARDIKINKTVQNDVSKSFRSESMPSDLQIVDITYVSINELEVTLSRPVDKVNAKNFSIEGVTVKKASLFNDKKRVTLIVDNLEYDERYTLKIRDVMINKEVQKDASASFQSKDMPSSVKLTEADYVSKTEVEVTFSRAVDSLKASNFIIDGLIISKVKLSNDKKSAILTVKNMEYNKRYTVKATGITQNKVVQADSTASFRSATAPASVYISDVDYITRSQIEVEFSKAVDGVKKENFSINGVEVSGAKLSKDKKSATLTLKTLEYGKRYTLRMKDVKVNGELQSSSSRSFWSEVSANDLDIIETKYLSQTEVELSFNRAIDGAKENNFSIYPTGNSNLLEKHPIIDKVKLSKDKKTVTLTLENLGYGKNYEIQAVDLQVNKVTQAAQYGKFKSAEIDEVWTVDIVTKKPKVMDDKKTEVEVTFQILNKQTRKVEKKASDFVLHVETDYGEFLPDGLSQYRLTTKSGTGKLTLSAPASEEDVTALISADIIEVPNAYLVLAGISGELELPIKATIPSSSFQIANVRGYLNGSSEDTIEITFTEGVQINEGKHDATDPEQYTVNGRELDAENTMITVRDEVGDIANGDINKGYKTVIIILPDKTLRGDYNNIVSVNPKLLSYGYTLISGNTARAFWGVNNVSNDSINEPGISTGNITVQQVQNIESMGPEDGIRTVQGNVTIYGSNAVKTDGKLYLENLTINGDLRINSQVEEVDLAASVTVMGDIIIDNDNIKRVINRGQVSSITVESATSGHAIDFINENIEAVPEVVADTSRPINLTGKFKNVKVTKPTTVDSDEKVEKAIVDTEGAVTFNGEYGQMEVTKPATITTAKEINDVIIKTTGNVHLKGDYNNVDIFNPVTLTVEKKIENLETNTLGPIILTGAYNNVSMNVGGELQLANSSTIDAVILDAQSSFTLKGKFENVSINQPANLEIVNEVKNVMINAVGLSVLIGNTNGYENVIINQPSTLDVAVVIEKLTADAEAIVVLKGLGQVKNKDGLYADLLVIQNNNALTP